MSTDRVNIGRYANGSTMGLRVALPGFSAFTAPDDPNQISFDSEWSDLVKVHQVGIASFSPNFPGSVTVLFPNLGYNPFVEVRKMVGTTIYDDFYISTRAGIGMTISTDRIVYASADPAFTFIYAVYRIPVPN